MEDNFGKKYIDSCLANLAKKAQAQADKSVDGVCRGFGKAGTEARKGFGDTFKGTGGSGFGNAETEARKGFGDTLKSEEGYLGFGETAT